MHSLGMLHVSTMNISKVHAAKACRSIRVVNKIAKSLNTSDKVIEKLFTKRTILYNDKNKINKTDSN